MELFEIPNPCPQCESLGASYKHHETPCPEVGADGEHWHRQCPFCAHEWAEAPLSRLSVASSPSSVDLTGAERAEDEATGERVSGDAR